MRIKRRRGRERVQVAEASQELEQPLFREEALREHSNRLWGQVVLAQPLSARVLTPCLVLMTLAIGWFVTHQEFARTETVQGYLTPSVGVSKLSPSRRGTVTEVFAEVGRDVEAGEVLLKVSSDEALGDGAEVGAALHDAIEVQRRELEAKLDAGGLLYEQEQVRNQERRKAVQRQVEQLARHRDAALERLDIAQDKVATSRQLARRDLVARTALQADRDRALELQSDVHQLEAELVEKRDELARVDQELRAAPLQRKEAEADLRMRLSELDSRATELANRASYAVVAPVAGRVAALQAVPGATVDPNFPVAVILPRGGKLEANLLVPTRAIGFVEVGQPVGIKYAAFPYQQFGIQHATVARVARTILSPDELRIPVAISEPVYGVVVELDEQSVSAYGRPYPLQLGMLLEGEIVLARRTVLEWILEPLYSLRASA